MQNTLKRLIAPVRYLRRYKNPFWRWVDMLDRANLWEITVQLYGVDILNGHDTLNSMIAMCNKIMYSALVPVSQSFHLQFIQWEGELQHAELISNTLKLHKVNDMETLEARVFSLRKVCARAKTSKDPEVEDVVEVDEVGEDPIFPEIAESDTSPVKRLESIRKKQDIMKHSPSENKSLFESLQALTHRSLGSKNMCDITDLVESPCPVNFSIPDSFMRKYSNGSTIDGFGLSAMEDHVQCSPPNLQASKSTDSDSVYSNNVITELSFPFRYNPLETIVSLTKEVVEAKLAINPEAWIKSHFLTSVWEMFHFGEEKIGNFVIAPNYLKDKEEEPSLDIFFWSGSSENLNFYACPINRKGNVFLLHESNNTFPSLVSLVAFYAFNSTDDLPVLLQSPCLTELIPTIALPSNITLQELYIIRILEYNPECWLTQEDFGESEVGSEVGSFIIHEDLYRDCVKLYVRVDTPYGLRVDSFEISVFENCFGLLNSMHRFASIASLISHYCCWPTDDISCLLKIPTFDLPDNDTTHSMHLISKMIEEVYIARDLSLHPQSWYIPNTNPNSIISKLMNQPKKTFAVVEYEDKYKLILIYQTGEPPIQYTINKLNSEFSIQIMNSWFPSLPLLIAYLCCNQCAFLQFQLSVPKFTQIDIKDVTVKPQNSIDTFQELNFIRSVQRKSGKINKQRQSVQGGRGTKQAFEYMQELVIQMTQNPDFWSSSDIPEAIDRLTQRSYRSFMVVHSSQVGGDPILLVRDDDRNPSSVAQFRIYQSKTGTCGFKRKAYIYSTLPAMLAQCCCVVDEDLPFMLSYERSDFDQSSC